MKKLVIALAVLAVVCVGCSSGAGTKKSEGEVEPAPVVSTAPTTSTTDAPTSTTVAPTTTTTARATTTTAPKPTTTTKPPATTTTSAPASSTYYANCDAARAAGAAPLYRGDPGYRSGLDRDGDGVACE